MPWTSTSPAVLRVAGELDLATAPGLTCEAEDVLADHVDTLVLDLRAVELMDSSGAGGLLAIRRRCQRAGALLVLVVGDGPVRRLLERLGLDQVFHVVEPGSVAAR